MDSAASAHDFDLDEQAQRALAVALDMSGAIGDDQCGTEYLLYGAMSTARGDVAELAGLFALDPLRLERGIHTLRQHRFSLEHDGPGAPPLTARAQRALLTPRIDGSGPTGVFELLHGLCDDESSGACQVLRELGVRPAELRRLISYGTRHLEPEQLDELLDALDRRETEHRPWWGP
ncbi:MAG: Clp protease N-terminal domain-containing protein, partial [Acidimicrobiales bacterium]